MARRAQAQADLDRLKNSGADPVVDHRCGRPAFVEERSAIAGYNVQIAVDAKHKLIAASEVVNDGNDTGQLYEVAEAAKEALGAQTLHGGRRHRLLQWRALKECEEGGIVAYVPPPKRTGSFEAQGRFTHEAFNYDAEPTLIAALRARC